MPSSLLRILVPLGALFLAASAQAASMGALQVHSRLGQSFLGEIEVTGEKAELDGLSVVPATPAAYLANGLDYEAAIRGLRLEMERKSETRVRVRLRSDGGVNLPIGNLLIEARWAGGSLRRDYTFLLDPPEELRQATVAAPSSVAPVSGPAPLALSASDSPHPPATAVAADPATPASATAGEYRTGAGDTLERIARKAPAGAASTIQNMAAIYQANPDAFVKGDAGRLRRNVVLKMPDEAAATKLDAAAARKVVMQASGGFDAQRKAVAVAAQAAPATEGEATRSAQGRIEPVVEEPTPTRAAGGRLRIGQAEGKVSAATRQRIQALEEEIANKSKSLEEQNSRIQELESMSQQLNTLLAMQQEASAPAAADASQPVAMEASAPEENLAMPALPPATTDQADAPVTVEAPVMRNAREPREWYQDPAAQILLLIIASLAAAWLGYRRYRERKWREADREMQRERGMPVDESVLSLA